MAVNAVVSKTDAVSASTRNEALEALNDLDNQINPDVNRYVGHTNLDNDKSYPGTSRFDWINYVEDSLYDSGDLTTGLLHVILYDRSDFWNGAGAGFSTWTVGGYVGERDFGNDKSYRNYDYSAGQYGLAHVNTATKAGSYTTQMYKNTVMHEAGHLFNCRHHDGEITQQAATATASPMCTWYVEQDCVWTPTNNSEPGQSLCYDFSGSKDACNHDDGLGSCASSQINTWSANHYEI